MSDDYGLTADELASWVSDLRMEATYASAAIALMLYDTALTFPQEIQFVWKKKWSVMTVLFLIIRHVEVIALAMEVVFDFTISPITAADGPLPIMKDTDALLTLQMFSDCHYAKYPGYDGILCHPTVFATASDLLVLWATWVAVSDSYKLSADLKLKSSLSRLLVRSGFVQFSLMALLNVVSVVLTVLPLTLDPALRGPGSAFTYINEAVASILLSRFMLDLRAVNHGDPNASLGQASSINFVGNAGALMRDLDDISWNIGTNHDVMLDDEDIVYSKNPIAEVEEPKAEEKSEPTSSDDSRALESTVRDEHIIEEIQVC
ncbi:hypothetical protein K474DRAFT_1711900 [Panus rudis PR-1116 ss-1]|nr:hypothetical protein K474DRAFT_1711900 [Panus rudis PR-1116 ss-1]